MLEIDRFLLGLWNHGAQDTKLYKGKSLHNTPDRGQRIIRTKRQQKCCIIECSETGDIDLGQDGHAPARAYAMKVVEDIDAPDVIVGNFIIFDIIVHALIDLRSTHSYVCTDIPKLGNLPRSETEYDILVTNPLGHSIIVNRVYKDCPIRIREYEFPGDLIELSFRKFDVILVMDWLSRHQAIIDCRMKRVTLRTSNEDEVTFIDERSNRLSNVISAATARTMVRKGCEPYLAYVIETEKAMPSVSDIPTVSDFLDVFPEEFPGLPPQREIEFSIDIVPGATPTSITPY